MLLELITGKPATCEWKPGHFGQRKGHDFPTVFCRCPIWVSRPGGLAKGRLQFRHFSIQ